MAEKTELATAYIKLIPSMGGARNQIKEELGAAGAEGGETFTGKLKGAIAAAGLGVAVSAALKSGMDEGGALEQSIGGINTLFKSSADTMFEYAKEAYKTCGLSANEFMEQSTSFAASMVSAVGGDTAKAAEMANQALIDMSDNANKMGTDMDRITDAYQGFAKQNYTINLMSAMSAMA